MDRKTDSYLPPTQVHNTNPGEYNLYPAFEIKDEVFCDLDVLTRELMYSRKIVIDGYEGVLWEYLMETLCRSFEKLNKNIRVINVADYLKSEQEIDSIISPYMGDKDSIFGKMTDLSLEDFFRIEELKQIEHDDNYDISIVYGYGASLCSWDAQLIYVDLPKNELQFRMAAGKVFNIGCSSKLDSRESYKRCYFIDWPILDQYKGELISKIDWIIDEQRTDSYAFMSGDAFRTALEEMCHSCFRARPWFSPGVWGGTYMRDHFKGLNRDVENLAWSFELMPLENGIMFQHNGILMETSFSFLMSYGYKAILGHCAEDFKEDFPIRFDFLDTVEGGNLSIQCHPSPEYIKSEFGKKYTQDETYYILNATADAKVYLGFQETIDKDEFAKDLRNSEESGNALDIEKHVRKFESKAHDLFLIPNGTIHASGSGNLVLEISSAPYIFTFKMYDWVRLDMDARPRPINIDHGLKNVRFDYKGNTVDQTLISKPSIIEVNTNYTLEHLPTHEDHFYDVHRYRVAPSQRINLNTNNRCHVWMLVEGQSVIVEMKNGVKQRFNYLETFIIPAASDSYSVYNESGEDVVLVKAFVKDKYKL